MIMNLKEIDTIYSEPDLRNLIFKDAKTEGKKAGYVKAADLFNPQLDELKEKCNKLVTNLTNSKESLGKIGRELLTRKEELEKDETRLKKLVEEYEKRMSDKYNISSQAIGNITGSNSGTVGTATLLFPLLFPTFSLFSALATSKKLSYRFGFFEGFDECANEYKKKIDDINKKYAKTEHTGNEQISNILNAIYEIEDNIVNLQQRIAALHMVMKGK